LQILDCEKQLSTKFQLVQKNDSTFCEIDPPVEAYLTH
jgi:hypothetical protein